MPLVPERKSSRNEVKSAISGQFWESPVHSTRYLDGVVWSLPCEPPALSLMGSSGLSRTQQLIAAQAVGVPAVPSYDSNSDGLVFDRVLARVGGRKWWTAVTGRAKVQRIYKQASSGGSKLDSLRDADSYALCARTRFQVGPRITLNGTVEMSDVRALHTYISGQHNNNNHRHQTPPPLHQLASEELTSVTPTPVTASNTIQFPSPTSPTTSMRERTSTPSGNNTNATTSTLASKPTGLGAIHGSIRCALPGHDLTASIGKDLDYVDSAGDYARIPLAVSVDLSSLDRGDGLQYRVGFHQVTAPPTEGSSSSGGGGSSSSGRGGNQTIGRHHHHHSVHTRSVLHAQGAVAVEGEAYVWRGGNTSGSTKDSGSTGTAANTATGGASTDTVTEATGGGSTGTTTKTGASQAAVDEKDSSGGNGAVVVVDDAEDGEGEKKSRIATALETATAADEGKPLPNSTSSGKETDAATTSGDLNNNNNSTTATITSDDVSSASQQPSSSSFQESFEGFIRPLEELGNTITSNIHLPDFGSTDNTTTTTTTTTTSSSEDQSVSIDNTNTTSAAATDPSTSESSSSTTTTSTTNGIVSITDSDATLTTTTMPLLKEPHSLPLSAESISAAIQESLALLTQVRDSVARVTGEVQDGSLQRLSEQLSRKAPPRRRPYSMLLGQPYVKLNAAMGCLARMPLPHFTTSGRSSVPGGIDIDHPTMSGFARRNASTSSLASRASVSSQLAEAWEPYLKGTALRVFASASISGQIGKFSRRFLDYTAGVARVDVGLSSPHVVGAAPGTMDASHRPDKHRAFALEGRGSWHALSASLTQQVWGPVRARADFRFALDPTNVPQDQGERSTLKGLAQTALSVRPSLLEAVYGFDMVLPGTEGAGRVALWWSPKRGEAMAELRLF